MIANGSLSFLPFCSGRDIDGFVKSPKTLFSVIPAEVGIQERQGILDPGVRQGDGAEAS
jgi:hypothetical protein